MKAVTLGLAVVCLLVAPSARAELITNGGFESGTAGWTITPGSKPSCGVGTNPILIHSGSAGFYFAAWNDPDTISQTLATTPGQNYAIQFWLKNADSNGYASFTVTWGGTQLLHLTPPSGSSFPFTLYRFERVAAAASTVISFAGYNNAAHWALDDVSVTEAAPTPEPAAVALAGIGIAVRAFRRRRRA